MSTVNLKELGARLRRLSYSEMVEFGSAVTTHINSNGGGASREQLIGAVLHVAETLESTAVKTRQEKVSGPYRSSERD